MEEQLDLVAEVYQLIANFLVNYSFQLLGALLVLVLGFIVGGWISRAVLRLIRSVWPTPSQNCRQSQGRGICSITRMYFTSPRSIPVMP